MRSQEYWDNYWQQGHITSFASEIDGTYGGEIKRFWQQALAPLKGQSKILDLCSGNGALPLLFLEVDPTLNIVATDLAKLDEPSLVSNIQKSFPQAAIEFRSRVDCTALPFGESEFDVVTSQFGFEYTETHRVLTEVDRVLKPNGLFIAVMHCHESRFIQQNSQSLALLDKMFTSDFFPALVEFIEAVETNNKPKEKYAEVNRQSSMLYSFDKTEFELMNVGQFLQVLMSNVETGKGKGLYQLFYDDMDNYRKRLTELVKAAQTEHDIDKMLAFSASIGFDVIESSKLLDTDGVLGQQLVLRK